MKRARCRHGKAEEGAEVLVAAVIEATVAADANAGNLGKEIRWRIFRYTRANPLKMPCGVLSARCYRKTS